MKNSLSIEFLKAEIADVPSIFELERSLFEEPWSEWMIWDEVQKETGEFICVKLKGQLLGYGSYYYVLDEGHITNLAIRPDSQGHGYGSLLLIRLIQGGQLRGVKNFTLEVRRSNLKAINLYQKFGFELKGVRKNYYPVSREDAMILWTPDITSPDYIKLLQQLAKEIVERSGKL